MQGTAPNRGVQDSPGWVTDQWKFWRGLIKAGPGPAAMPSPLAPTGHDEKGKHSSGSVDTQTYPFQIGQGGAPTLIVARQPNRKSLSIQNTGITTLQVFIGSQSQNQGNASLGITIAPGATKDWPAGVAVDEIYAWTNGAGATGVVVTGN